MEHPHQDISPFPFEEDDLNNISKDDSEDFAVEDTAFFRSAAPDPPPSISGEFLSPVPSPTPPPPFGTPRVRSAHSLYGEALLQSTRPLSTSNNTCSTTEEEDKNNHMIMYALQQPFIPEENNSSSCEELLVSPTSAVSETPTTPPSVAQRPALSPPPLLLPALSEDAPAPETIMTAAANSNNNNPQQQQQQQQQHYPLSTATIGAETLSYSSRTPLRPPRVPGNQSRLGAAASNNNNNTNTPVSTLNNNSSGHKRQHRRNESDNSLLSALTDATFGSIQTDPPPSRSALPLPLLSSSSSWTRYTNLGQTTGHHLPILETEHQQHDHYHHHNTTQVSGMNISVPAKLQQPVLAEDGVNAGGGGGGGSSRSGLVGIQPLPQDTTTTTAGPSTIATPGSSNTPVHRQSTPPRHRPPKDRTNTVSQKGSPSKSSQKQQQQRSPSNDNRKIISSGMAGAAASASSLSPSQAKLPQPPPRTSNVFRRKPSSPGNNNAAATSTNFLPIPHRPRSFSSEHNNPTSSPVLTTKPRSYSDVLLPGKGRATTSSTIDTLSLPGFSLASLFPPPSGGASEEHVLFAEEELALQQEDSIQLQAWFKQAFPSTERVIGRPLSCAWGAALLKLDELKHRNMVTNISPLPDTEDLSPSVQDETSTATSSIADLSRQSPCSVNKESHAVSSSRTSSSPSELQQPTLVPAMLVGLLSVLISTGIFHGDKNHGNGWSFLYGLQQVALFFLVWKLSSSLLQDGICLGMLRRYGNDETCFAFLLSKGWPLLLATWALLEVAICAFIGNALLMPPESVLTLVRLAWVVFGIGVMEVLRRYHVGHTLNCLLYRRCGHKVQHALQSVTVLRRIARIARLQQKDSFVNISEEPDGQRSCVLLEDLTTLYKSCAALRSSRAFSKEFGPVGSKKERKASAEALYDALSAQGRLARSTLQEAVDGNDLLTSVMCAMFPPSASDGVTRPEFLSAIESTYQSVHIITRAVENELSLLRAVDSLSAFLWNASSICVATGLSSLVSSTVSAAGVLGIVALVVGLASTTCFEGCLFVIYTRPYILGDVILLNDNDKETRLRVEEFDLLKTCVKCEGRATYLSSFSNSILSRSKIQTMDGLLPASVCIRLKVSLEASQREMEIFRKAVEEYIKDHVVDWTDLLSIDTVDVSSNFSEIELAFRHRQTPAKMCSVRSSRVNLENYCYQALSHLGIDGRRKIKHTQTSGALSYNSDDSILKTASELDFLKGSK